MDYVKLVQTFELVARRHSRRSPSPWPVWTSDDRNSAKDFSLGRPLLFHDWARNHSWCVPFI
jgi:hypothetical protein